MQSETQAQIANKFSLRFHLRCGVRFVIRINSRWNAIPWVGSWLERQHVLFTERPRNWTREKQVELSFGASWWQLLIVIAPEKRKEKNRLLLLIENDVHTKITINQILCSSVIFSAVRIVWLMVSTTRLKSFDSLVHRAALKIYVYGIQMPSNRRLGYWL